MSVNDLMLVIIPGALMQVAFRPSIFSITGIIIIALEKLTIK